MQVRLESAEHGAEAYTDDRGQRTEARRKSCFTVVADFLIGGKVASGWKPTLT
jgi:hypothetical protein